MDKNIDIVGAGPAGLTAAIILKQEGYNPIVYEREATFGTDPTWHPSVHATPANLEGLKEYTGIDFSSQFHEFGAVSSYFRNFYNYDEVEPPPDLYNRRSYAVERGQRESSLDAFLYHMAIDNGVEVKFNSTWNEDDFKSAKPNTIVATGLNQKAYEDRGEKFTPFHGYWTSFECDPDLLEAGCFKGDFTNEYAYYTSVNGLWYCLLFARGDISKEALEEFSKIIKATHNLDVQEWKRFTGASARHPRLFDENFIFTGTAAGMIEPAGGYGITGALLSGRIAATAIYDREKAQMEYDKFMNPVKGNVALKFKEREKYVPGIFMGPDDLWFDIPTIRSDMRDSEAKKLPQV